MGKFENTVQQMQNIAKSINIKAQEKARYLDKTDYDRIMKVATDTIEVINEASAKLERAIKKIRYEDELNEFLDRVVEKCIDAKNYAYERFEEIAPTIADGISKIETETINSFNLSDAIANLSSPFDEPYNNELVNSIKQEALEEETRRLEEETKKLEEEKAFIQTNDIQVEEEIIPEVKVEVIEEPEVIKEDPIIENVEVVETKIDVEPVQDDVYHSPIPNIDDKYVYNDDDTRIMIQVVEDDEDFEVIDDDIIDEKPVKEVSDNNVAEEEVTVINTKNHSETSYLDYINDLNQIVDDDKSIEIESNDLKDEPEVEINDSKEEKIEDVQEEVVEKEEEIVNEQVIDPLDEIEPEVLNNKADDYIEAIKDNLKDYINSPVNDDKSEKVKEVALNIANYCLDQIAKLLNEE